MTTHRICLLIYPGFQLLDAAGPLSAFEYAGRCYALRVVARQPGLVPSSAGPAWQAEALPRPSQVDTLLVAGGNGVDAALQDAGLRAWARRVAARGARVASVCSGSLLLAAAGLLDGRRATTHWLRAEQLQREYPTVQVEADSLYVQDGSIWTSAGISAGIDLALALIAADLGEEPARRVARALVVYFRRPGGQSQFSELGRLQGPRFEALLAWARQRLHEPLPVERLAAQACMSPRHFARAFVQETGLTPAKAVERLRVEAARAALESGTAAQLQTLARDCGLGDSERMKRSFQRVLGVAPAQLRAP
ncbi:GlxA family transcriptional regulator [Inhella proteolytica]|uniref:DJ-1/PfpI family protein n=1 Tax=Inhella proteolytica TaxID=2795029 RepID=A0A931ND25_9BURK|nr:DJ-1/PfpI family protein [Inhella proteolytica]MBH9576212.1 DJ-1/PfpI family protein [Inhella proteolytica]